MYIFRVPLPHPRDRLLTDEVEYVINVWTDHFELLGYPLKDMTRSIDSNYVKVLNDIELTINYLSFDTPQPTRHDIYH